MRFLPPMLSLTMAAVLSTAGSAGHLDDVEDAAEDYRKAVGKVHKELKKEKYAPPYLVQMTHRLERAADRLEELADDEADLYTIRGAYEEVAALHARFTELTYDPHVFAGRHAAKRLDDIQRRFAELHLAADYLLHAHPSNFGRRAEPRRGDHFGYPPTSHGPPHHLQRHAPHLQRHHAHRFELQVEIAPRAHGRGHHLEQDLRKGRWEMILPRLR